MPERSRMNGKSGNRSGNKNRNGLKILTAVCLTIALTLLSGCSARELEERKFPLALEVGAMDGKLVLACAWPGAGGEEQGDTLGQKGESGETTQTEEISDFSPGDEPVNNESITAVWADTAAEAVEGIQSLQAQYVDYSQVRAILWDVSMREEPKLEEELLLWLENSPAFARNLLIFTVSSQELTLQEVQEQSRGRAGAYLENLYRNNPAFRETARTLEEVLYMPERKR